MNAIEIFKHLPGGKKIENANCKKCGFPTCMAFAIKLASKNTQIEKCPFVSSELKQLFEKANRFFLFDFSKNRLFVCQLYLFSFKYES